MYGMDFELDANRCSHPHLGSQKQLNDSSGHHALRMDIFAMRFAMRRVFIFAVMMFVDGFGPAPYRPISSPVASRQMSPFYGR